MSSFDDPALRGAVYPTEEELDPAEAYTAQPRPRPSVEPPPPDDTAARSIVSRHADGSVQVVTDFDGDGVADVVQVDLDGDGVPDVTYIDSDRDGRLDTVLRTPDH